MESTNTLSARMLEPGAVLGARYEILRLIGSGGMAAVYLAKDTAEDSREIALKTLHKEFSEDKAYVERFIREIKLIHKIDHPNIVKTFDIRSDGGMIYYTMEYIDGESLEERMERKGFSNQEIADLIIQVCKGLQVIHQLEIVHRDLKPGNILIAKNGTIKIVDFGVAREKSSRLTQPNQKVGSLCYIAPEVWLGKEITPSVDFYSLGIMLYELVTGNVPFEHPLPGKMLQLHLSGKVTPPSKVNNLTPVWLNDLIMKLLAKSPKDRPRNAEAIIGMVTPVRLAGAFDNETADMLSKQTHELGSADKAEPAIITPTGPRANRVRGKTYVFKLTATRLIEDADQSTEDGKPRRRVTVVINLPKRAALVLDIEAPSRDVIYFGMFLMSLQMVDAVLTAAGLPTWGVDIRENPVLRSMTHTFGRDDALFAFKGSMIALVVLLTMIIKRKKLFRDLVGALSCLYLLGAISPWLFFFWNQFRVW